MSIIEQKTWQENLNIFLETIQKTAIERDKIGGHPRHERQLIRDLKLLNLATPKDFGGENLSWVDILKVCQQVAVVDSSLAHILAFHYLQLKTIELFASEEQAHFYYQQTTENGWFWGNAVNPNDKRATASIHDNYLTVTGSKSYCSGSVGADYLTASAWDDKQQGFWFFVVPTSRKGVAIQENWDAFGQKQTDSGQVDFDHVQINKDEIILIPEQKLTPFQTLRTLMAQSILITLYLGLAQGAYQAVLKELGHNRKAWFTSIAKTLPEDVYIQQRLAKLHIALRSAQLLSDTFFHQLSHALHSKHLSQEERGEIAIASIEAKYAAHQAAISISNDIFEILGASSTSNKLGLDRFWRNARVHTLHDPIDYKLQDLGRFLALGIYPTPTAYS